MAVAVYIIIVFVVLGIINLVVGVSNDAVNFLNSAIGSRVAKRRIVLWVAAAGLVLGAFFSSGMMDLARSGVIYPQNFTFNDLMAVFAAVVFVHIVLIDALNAYGLPTSTTTALIFQLIGGALAIAVVKSAGLGHVSVGTYIDTNQVFLIIAGIFVSVFAAFLLGTVVQFVSRFVFTFNYRDKLGWAFSLAGAFAVTVIFYLIIKKALYTDMFELGAWYQYIHNHLPEFLVGVFAFVFFVFWVAVSLFNIDVPRWVVFFGTFALAMSFTSNDLVNFIGVPLAAVESTWFYMGGNSNAADFTLGALNGGVSHPFSAGVYMALFFAAGVVMSVTMFFSRKAQAVIDTEIFLEQQGSGYERFEPSHLSRSVVRHFFNAYQQLKSALPLTWVRLLDDRFQRPPVIVTTKAEETSYFDMVRASVNLTMASAMILIGTWLNMPLSTTFIVFMVSMGTSLADRAWGRDSAVFRLSGVFTILGTWFFTSCVAVTGAFVLTLFIWYIGLWSMLPLLLALFFILRKSTRVFKNRQTTSKVQATEINEPHNGNDWFAGEGSEQFRKHVLEASMIYFLALQGFVDEDAPTLKLAKTKARGLVEQIKAARNVLFVNLKFIPDQSLESGHHFVQALDYISELANCLGGITESIFTHLHNNHKGLSEAQKSELEHLIEETSSFFNHLVHIEKEQKFASIDELVQKQKVIVFYLDDLRKSQIKRIRNGESKTRVSALYMDILSETKNILLYSLNILKSHRDFDTALNAPPK